MILRTQLKATLETYLVEFQDATASVVDPGQIDCNQSQIGSTVLVNNIYIQQQ